MMNDYGRDPNKQQPQNPGQPFDYHAHYQWQNQQYQNPQQPHNAQYNQGPQQEKPPVPPVQPNYTWYSVPVNNTKAFSVMSYISILWLVGLLADKYNPKVRFHVNQGIILTIFKVILDVLVSILKSVISSVFTQSFSGIIVVSQLGVTLNGMLTLTAWGLYLSFMIIGIMNAVHDREVPLPIIGTLFKVLK